jgi:hypothetical protein
VFYRCFHAHNSWYRYTGPTQPLVEVPTLETQGQPTGIQTIPHAAARQQKQQFKSTRRKPTGKNTHIGIRQQELAKEARQQKEEKDIYTFSTNLILILLPILTSPKPNTLIF